MPNTSKHALSAKAQKETTSERGSQITRVGIAEVQPRLKDFVFVDARSATSQARDPTQVPDAIHVPIKELDQRARSLPHNRTLITYCT